MYEVWHSSGGQLRPGPKFRLLGDAVAHIRERAGEASWAIRTPQGTWYRDPVSGRSIFGKGAGLPGDRVLLERMPAATAFGSGRLSVPAPIEEEDTQPYMASVRRAQGTSPKIAAIAARPDDEDDDECTDVTWPPPGSRGFKDEVTPL